MEVLTDALLSEPMDIEARDANAFDCVCEFSIQGFKLISGLKVSKFGV